MTCNSGHLVMAMMKAGATVALLAFLTVTALGQNTIVIGPNVLVSRDGDVAHVESHVAANPRDPRNVLGTAITFTSPTVGPETKVYASFDGGWTWTDRYFPDHRQQGAWDPQVAFGVTGTAYLATMVYTNNRSKSNAVAFYRSEDGGQTWSKPMYLGFNYDRNAIVVDNSQSRFRGRLYVTSHGTGIGMREAQLFRSADDGRTFHGPVSTHCRSVHSLLTLSDGTLWIPCEALDKDSMLGPSHGGVMSVDGGKTLTPFLGRPVTSIDRGRPVPSSLVFAVDTTSRFRDRIYAIWLQEGLNRKEIQIMLRYSSDRGRSWSAPLTVAPVSQEGALQWLPTAVVNRNGILGIVWFEALAPDYVVYDWFFTVSVDGGDNFLPARKLTSASSQPDHPQNRAITPIGGIRQSDDSLFFSAYSRWKRAGDYTGLTSDANGVFHPFWPDARRGAFQLYTSRIMVETAPRAISPPQATVSARVMDQELKLEYGPPIVPREGSDEVIVVSIRNVSGETIWGPFVVTVTMSVSGRQSANIPDIGIIFDPRSGRWSRRATIEYTAALRDIPFLAPGAATEAIEWRFRNSSGGQLNLTTHIYAGHAPQQ